MSSKIIAEYLLNLDEPELNQCGAIAFECHTTVEHGKYQSMLKKISIAYPIADLRDLNTYTADLLQDRTGILVTLPKFPKFLVEDVDKLYKEDDPNRTRDQMRGHMGFSIAYKRGWCEATNKIVLRFPKGIKCNTSFWNHGSGQNRLIGRLIGGKRGIETDKPYKGDANERYQACGAMEWSLVVEGTQRLCRIPPTPSLRELFDIEEKEEDESTDDSKKPAANSTKKAGGDENTGDQ